MSNTTTAPAPLFSPSTIILNPYAQAYVDQANIQIAPWVMGTFADLFLQGIIASQLTNYFTYNTGETRRRFTWLVLLVTFLCLLKSAQNIVIVWDTVIATFANPDLSMMLVGIDWWHYTTSLSTAIIATIVQCFFVYRYWLLTKRVYVCVFMGLCMTVSLVGAALVIVYISRIDHVQVKKWSLVHFVAAIILDASITSLTAWHLYKQKVAMSSAHTTPTPSGLPTSMPANAAKLDTPIADSTGKMIDRLIKMTWQSALPPTLCVIVNAIVLEALPLELTHIAFNMILPKLYAISLLYTLNCRNEIRGERNGTTSATHSRGISGGPNAFSSRKGQSFMPAQRTFGGTEITSGTGYRLSNAYRSPERDGAMERGISIGRGRGRSNSGGRKLGTGVHVETRVERQISSKLGGDDDLELDDFPSQSDGTKAGGAEYDFENAVWEGEDKKGGYGR